MSSNKFFTWTKGDKKHASAELLCSSGVVQIPVECLSTKDVEYLKNAVSKTPARKPLPLSFNQSSPATSQRSTRTNDSIALQDAAVQSATNLMAVMNDMLRSPPLSAHFALQQQVGADLTHCRPRSRTAPPTPLVEAHPPELAELPGSLPLPQGTGTSKHQSLGPGPLNSATSIQGNTALPDPIKRPHSIPHDSTCTIPDQLTSMSESRSHSTTTLFPTVDPIPRSMSSSPYKEAKIHDSGHTDKTVDALARVESQSRNSLSRPGPSAIQSRAAKSPTPSDPRLRSPSEASRTVQRIPSSPGFPSMDQSSMAYNTETALLEQIGLMRAEHEAHIHSLKEAHAREIASHLSYVTFLEKRRNLLPPSPMDPRQHLTIDTAQVAGKRDTLTESEPSANGSLQSLDSCLDRQKRDRSSTEAAAEIEALKRKLSLSQKTQVELGNVRKERNYLREKSERNDRRIVQLKDIIRKSKENDATLRNALLGLEERLTAANIQRADVLEGYHEACEQVRMLVDRERCLVNERDDLRAKLVLMDPQHNKHAASSDAEADRSGPFELDTRRATLRSDPLLQQLDELRRTVADRELQLEQLQRQSSRQGGDILSRKDSGNTLSFDDYTELQRQLTDCQQQLSKVASERDQYNSALHAELRRKTRHAAHNANVTTPQIEAEVCQAMSNKLGSLHLDTTTGSRDLQVSRSKHDEVLERELRHCLQEIIMYKLDIKGYRKDLRHAQAKIDRLQTSCSAQLNHPATPESLGKASAVARCQSPVLATDATHSPRTPGLGISLSSPPATPSQTIQSATTVALRSAVSTPMVPTTPSEVPPRSKTPLSVHKKLPKPPSASATPDPYLNPELSATQVQRAETLRSLSESVISSYTQRALPHQHHANAMPSRGQSMRPSRSAKANTVTLPSPGLPRRQTDVAVETPSSF